MLISTKSQRTGLNLVSFAVKEIAELAVRSGHTLVKWGPPSVGYRPERASRDQKTKIYSAEEHYVRCLTRALQEIASSWKDRIDNSIQT